MSFDLQSNTVVLDGNDFEALQEIDSGKHFFAGRIENRGILNFGLVAQGEEVQIDLEENNISVPIIIDSIVGLAQNSTADEIIFYLYKKTDNGLVKVGTQRYSNGEMPIDFPDGIIFPGIVLGVKPTRADATIQVFVKPVNVLFIATPTQSV